MKKTSLKARHRADILRRQLQRKAYRRKIRRIELRARRKIALDVRRAYALKNSVPFDPKLERAQIILPSSLSLTTNYAATMQAVAEMRWHALSERRSLMLHLSTLEVVEPAAALVLVAEIDRIRHLRGRDAVTGTYPNDPKVHQLLCDMGFYSLLKVAEIGDRPRGDADPHKPIFLRFISDKRVPAEEVDRFVSIIERSIVALNDLARERLVAAIIEAMANTLDHAHPEPVRTETMRNRWWMSSRVSLVDKEVTIVLFDQGVGIPNTLEATSYESIRAALANISRLRLSLQPSDGEMILAATEYHRSGTGSSGRGRGFADMKRFVDICADGELRVLSNRGSYHYVAGREDYADAEISLGGTLIEWRFRDGGVVEMSDD